MDEALKRHVIPAVAIRDLIGRLLEPAIDSSQSIGSVGLACEQWADA